MKLIYFSLNGVLCTLLASLLLVPTSAIAAFTSENFSFDDMNFSSISTLSTDKNGVPPAISSDGPQIRSLSSTSVTIFWTTDKKATSIVDYGTSSARGSLAGNAEQTEAHTVAINGLKEQTKYYYQVQSEDMYGVTGTSATYSFTTPAATGFKEVSVTQIGYTDALVKVISGGVSQVSLSYSETQNFSGAKKVQTSSLIAENNFPLTGLKSGTKYYLSIQGEDSVGQPVIFNSLSFVTTANPAFSSIKIKPVSANELTVSATTNTPATLSLSYVSKSDISALTASDSNLSLSHEISLKKLFGATEYTLLLTAIDAGGKRIESEPVKASTLTDATPPKTTIPSVSIVKSGNSISVTARWDSDEPIRSRMRLVSTVNKSEVVEIPEASLYNTAVIMVANGLSPKTPYILQAMSTDASGNTITEEVNLVTPSIRKSIIELITENLSKVFEPISKLFNSI